MIEFKWPDERVMFAQEDRYGNKWCVTNYSRVFFMSARKQWREYTGALVS